MPDALPPENAQDPCVKICRIDPASGLCTGCRRTTREIATWRAMSTEERREVLAALPARQAGPARRRS